MSLSAYLPGCSIIYVTFSQATTRSAQSLSSAVTDAGTANEPRVCGRALVHRRESASGHRESVRVQHLRWRWRQDRIDKSLMLP